jgi:hypothetical protein
LGYNFGLGDQLHSYCCDCDRAPPTITSKEKRAAAIAGCEGLGFSRAKAFYARIEIEVGNQREQKIEWLTLTTRAQDGSK